MALSDSNPLHQVPVVCKTTDSKFYGKCYMEKISDILTLNGEEVSEGLTEADFKSGDDVTIRRDGGFFVRRGRPIKTQ